MRKRTQRTKAITRNGKFEAQYDDQFPDPEGFNNAISEVTCQASSEARTEDHETKIENRLEVDGDGSDQLPEWEIIHNNLGI